MTIPKKDRVDTLKEMTDGMMGNPSVEEFYIMVRLTFVIILEELRDLRDRLRKLEEPR